MGCPGGRHPHLLVRDRKPIDPGRQRIGGDVRLWTEGGAGLEDRRRGDDLLLLGLRREGLGPRQVPEASSGVREAAASAFAQPGRTPPIAGSDSFHSLPPRTAVEGWPCPPADRSKESHQPVFIPPPIPGRDRRLGKKRPMGHSSIDII